MDVQESEPDVKETDLTENNLCEEKTDPSENLITIEEKITADAKESEKQGEDETQITEDKTTDKKTTGEIVEDAHPLQEGTEDGELNDDDEDDDAVPENRAEKQPVDPPATETEAEEGELDDSSDEKTDGPMDHGISSKVAVANNDLKSKTDVLPSDEKKEDSSEIADDAVNDVKDGANRLEFGLDDARPEEEQLDYDEDDIDENQEKTFKRTKSNMTQDALLMERTVKERSDGEVDSDSDGEIKSEDDDPTMDDFEEGETRDHPLDFPPEQRKPCRFFEMGNCTWGDRCRFLHPGINDKGNYDMFGGSPKALDPRRMSPEPRRLSPPVFWDQHPPPFMHGPPPAAETAWEKGLRHAKELKKRAMQRKVQEPDFVQKREVISLNMALNEDRDMEFVDHRPLVPRNRGFDPFEEIEEDEYAIPPPEELRRRLHRDRPRGPPPPHLRPPLGKDHRPPPHDLPMRMEPRPRERRHPSPHRHPPPPHGHFPMEMRRMSPHRPYGGDREHRNDLPPPREPHPTHMPHPRDHPPPGRDRHERHDDAMFEKDLRPDGRPPYHADMNRENIPPEVKDRRRDGKHSDSSAKDDNKKNGTVRGDQWSDPWARTRPPARGRNKERNMSSSSSSSSSGSSSRSSSRSSFSSRSSYTGSSRSSSRSSGSSRSSSFTDSSRSPSPSKGKTKKKVLATTKQRNAVQNKNLPPSAAKPPPSGQAPPAKVPTPQAPANLPPVRKQAPPVVPKPPPTNAPLPSQRPPPPKKPTPKAAPKPKKRSSSSSSEFSHSDSSGSDVDKKNKRKSGSDSDSDSSSSGSSGSSSSSSSGSSSSDSEDEKKKKSKKTVKQLTKTKPPASKAKTTSINQPKAPSQQQTKGKVAVPSKPGRKDVKMTIIDKPASAPADRKRGASEMSAPPKKASASRRVELLEQLKAVEDAIARKRAKLT